MELSRRFRGCLVIFGGVLVHLSLGTVYTFGNMTPYVTSYIREYSSPADLTYATSIWIFAMSGMGQGLSMFLGGLLCQKIGPRLTTLLGSLFMSLGVLLTYFTIKLSFAVVVITYGLMFGFGVGIAYAIPIACAMRWMPEKKGLVSGFVVAGFGGGSFIFDQIQTAFINPENKSPQHEVDGVKYFTKKDGVLDNVPYMFLVMGGCYAAMQLIGSMLVVFPPSEVFNKWLNVSCVSTQQRIKKLLWNLRQSNLVYSYTYRCSQFFFMVSEAFISMELFSLFFQTVTCTYSPVNVLNVAKSSENKALLSDEECNSDEERYTESQEGVSKDVEAKSLSVERPKDESMTLRPTQILKEKSFYILWTIFLLNGQGIIFISTLYKAYGQTFINDDVFLALVGAFAAVFNAAGRIMWGHFADKTSFKVAMMCNCAVFTMLMLTIGLTSVAGKAMFFIWVCLLFLTFSGSFSLMPTATARSFGQTHYAVNYGLLFTSQVITNPIGAILTSQLKAVIGWYGMFFMVSAFSFASLLMTMTFNVKNCQGKDI
ncbi:uncharacterized protein LOC121383508 [Gigantopelta aegis]|uniref:uncharacterized protein LOC121383508 n=1 Tax=Gigantopelta aegis TaxID=1735272 RepID=UPI001B88A7B7|nr:uncharacterized protein LOC121383508 [Gigantopelta aegis]